MTPRLRIILAGVLTLLSMALPLSAQTDDRAVEVVDLTGVLDDRIMQFAIESIDMAEARGVEVVILQIDSSGVIGSEERLAELKELLSDPPVPVVAWIGPAPAVAYGGAAQLVAAAPVRMAAPGSEIGYWYPAIAGDEIADGVGEEPPVDTLRDSTLAVSDVTGFFDLVGPETAAPRQVAQALDGFTVPAGGGDVVLETIRPFRAEDGSTGVSVLPTRIREPGLWDRFLRLAARPEATFFFLVAGLTVAAFEFYAIGPGIAAGVAAVSLFLASYGLAVLPMRWWAVAVTIVAVFLMAAGFQRGGVAALSILGIVGSLVAGFLFTDAAPQITPGAPGVLLSVAAAAFFFLLAMPTVARSRFSTQTIGREHLIGRRGVAVGVLGPDGDVEVDGARWRATSHREAGIRSGDPVTVVAIDGLFLEVEPATDREN